jgi:hypothetical protein
VIIYLDLGEQALQLVLYVTKPTTRVL